jgi:hypothetical protein
MMVSSRTAAWHHHATLGRQAVFMLVAIDMESVTRQEKDSLVVQ